MYNQYFPEDAKKQPLPATTWLQMEYDLTSKALRFDKSGTRFEAQKPDKYNIVKSDKVEILDASTCGELYFSFKVKHNYIDYYLNSDKSLCFPLELSG